MGKVKGDQVTMRQLKLLLDFMEKHPSLAHGIFSRSKEGSLVSNKLWGHLTNRLNADPGGVQKPLEGWKKFYNYYKYRLKIKITSMRNGSMPTPSTVVLTPMERKLCTLLGGRGFNLPNNFILSSLEDQRKSNINEDLQENYKHEFEIPIQVSVKTEDLEMNPLPDEPFERESSPVDTSPWKTADQFRDSINRPRAKRLLRSGSSQSAASNNAESHLESIGSQIAAIEKSRLETDKAMIEAINRQAAVQERLAETLTGFIGVMTSLVTAVTDDIRERRAERDKGKHS